ncbi:MAG TPA: PAS domain S-box protein, partial [Puia sp.]|nr:PAS domain S-box protein [Puia sp.]
LRKRDAELRLSEDRYHKMIEEVEDYAILLLDKEGFIQNWNKGAEKIKGYKEEEIVGQNFRIFYLSQDRERKLPEKLIHEATVNGKAIHEGWRLRKDGSQFWGSIVITALHEGEEIVGFSKVTRDLTELKVANDRIIEYTRELEFQNKELQQFSYAAAHDLKEPLRKIQFYNASILTNADDILAGKERGYLQSSINAANRLSGLIDDLLKYSETALTSGKFERVNVTNVISEIVEFYKDLPDQGQIVSSLSENIVVTGIAFQIRQLFENLINNAIKYQSKERKLVVKILYSKVILNKPGSNEEADSYFHKISIEDNGIGFESEFAGKIFELFVRLQGRQEYPGNGVGLSICKRIIQNHRGLIEVSSNPGQGSVFHVFLPFK